MRTVKIFKEVKEVKKYINTSSNNERPNVLMMAKEEQKICRHNVIMEGGYCERRNVLMD